jgi:NUMOD4 motif-containing protein/HNH endonuclease
MEIWKDIKDFEGLYQVSNFGRVRSLPRMVLRGKSFGIMGGIILKSFLDKNGYLKVNLSNGIGNRFQKWVARLVAQAFIDNPLNKPQINHKDGIKTNNLIDNLEWVTGSENTQHAYDIGLLVCERVRNLDGTFV